MVEKIREIRINPIIPTESVLIVTERGHRPKKKSGFKRFDSRSFVSECPFCKGNEGQTPREIKRFSEDGEWQIRVIRNLYPAFGDDHLLPDLNLGIHYVIDGYGQHEVIIDHPNHGIHLFQMKQFHISTLFILYRDRMKHLYSVNENHRYVFVFKNFGPASGGSIPHTHSQIIAMPVVPANVEMELFNSRKYFREQGKCIFCLLMDDSLTYEGTVYDRTSGEKKKRIEIKNYIVDKGDYFVAIKPFFSRFPWEIHILPQKHCHDYCNISDAECMDLAGLLLRVMQRLHAVIGFVEYNYFLHSIPSGNKASEDESSFHWHLELCPRTTIPNGFELGSGLAINSISPEQAAEQLRAIQL